MHPRTIRQPLRLAALLAASASFAFGLQGCNDAQAGALLGAGVGALGGQAIGHDSEATAIGAGIGAVGGYIVGNEVEKSKARNRYNPNYDY